MDTEPDSAKEQAPSSNFDVGGEIQEGGAEGECTLTLFWSHSRNKGKEGKSVFGGNKKWESVFICFY